ncbi:MAG: DnaJ domain-containing protein [Magnetococcales bacterium]|nr:DnaJ domain-containing protein [Magnetococcales bacterium]
MHKDHYRTLRVSRNATQQQIRQAYRRLAREHHPDLNHSPFAEERFKCLGEAYEILGNPNKRAEYDESLMPPLHSHTSRAASQRPASTATRPGANGSARPFSTKSNTTGTRPNGSARPASSAFKASTARPGSKPPNGSKPLNGKARPFGTRASTTANGTTGGSASFSGTKTPRPNGKKPIFGTKTTTTSAKPATTGAFSGSTARPSSSQRPATASKAAATGSFSSKPTPSRPASSFKKSPTTQTSTPRPASSFKKSSTTQTSTPRPASTVQSRKPEPARSEAKRPQQNRSGTSPNTTAQSGRSSQTTTNRTGNSGQKVHRTTFANAKPFEKKGKSSFRGFLHDDYDTTTAKASESTTSATDAMPPAPLEADLILPLEQAAKGGKQEITLNLPELGGFKTFQVSIPPGSLTGEKITIPEKRTTLTRRLLHGEIHLTIQIPEHGRYRLEGRDLHTSLNLSPWEAALGTKIKFETLDGKVKIQIPSGSSSGRKIRLRNKGFPNGSEKKDAGDMFITLNICVPTLLTDEEKALFKKLADRSTFKPREF